MRRDDERDPISPKLHEMLDRASWWLVALFVAAVAVVVAITVAVAGWLS